MSTYDFTVRSGKKKKLKVAGKYCDRDITVEGTAVLQSKSVTPSDTATTVKADNDYDGLSQVIVNAMPKVDRATTSITTTADDTNDVLTITATNNQGTGYVTADSNKNTATKKVTLSVNKPTVDASGNVTAVATATDNSSTPVKVSKTSSTLALGVSAVNPNVIVTADEEDSCIKVQTYGYQQAGYVKGHNIETNAYVDLTIDGNAATISCGDESITRYVNEVGRATTSLTSAKSNNTLVFTAKNEQSTGYVTADTNKNTATKTVSISASGKTVTATDGTNSISASVSDGSCTVSGGVLSGGSAVTPTVTLSNGSDTNLDTTKVTVGSKDTTNYPYYFKVNGASSSGSSTVSRAAVTDTHTAGYISAKSATNVIAADSKTVTVNAGSGSSYVGIKAGGCTVSGGGLSVTNNYSGTPTVDITLDGQTFNGQTTSGAAITTTKPSSGYYLTLGASSSALSGTTKVTRAAVTDTHTAGYIPAKSATNVIASTTASPTVTVNKGTKTKYVTLPTATFTTSGNTVTSSSAGYVPANQTIATVSGGGGTTLDTCTVTVYDTDYCGIGSVTSTTLANGQFSKTVHSVPFGGSVTVTQAVGLPLYIDAGYCYGGISVIDDSVGDGIPEVVYYNSGWNKYVVVFDEEHAGNRIYIDVWG